MVESNKKKMSKYELEYAIYEIYVYHCKEDKEIPLSFKDWSEKREYKKKFKLGRY
jgi:hypothetical protein